MDRFSVYDNDHYSNRLGNSESYSVWIFVVTVILKLAMKWWMWIYCLYLLYCLEISKRIIHNVKIMFCLHIIYKFAIFMLINAKLYFSYESVYFVSYFIWQRRIFILMIFFYVSICWRFFCNTHTHTHCPKIRVKNMFIHMKDRIRYTYIYYINSLYSRICLRDLCPYPSQIVCVFIMMIESSRGNKRHKYRIYFTV